MKRFPSNLTPEDRRTYRGWTGGLFLSYLVAIIVAVGITFTNRPASDLTASNETQIARLKGPTASMAVSPLPAANPAFAEADQVRVQFCWAMGKFNKTIYFAEAENREDRQESFDTLLAISGIDHHSVECRVSDPTLHRLVRAKLIESWSESKFEIINTTFLSDLDY